MKQKFTCFLIDDDLDDQEIFMLALQDLDKMVNCVTAADGSQALQILNEDHSFIPDYIFLDLNMPRMDGKQFLAEIKKDARLRNIPVIIYSTSSDPRDLYETKQLGASDYIVKQTSIGSLRKILSTFLTTQKVIIP
jgi:CheY-like chemotaxis protein